MRRCPRTIDWRHLLRPVARAEAVGRATPLMSSGPEVPALPLYFAASPTQRPRLDVALLAPAENKAASRDRCGDSLKLPKLANRATIRR
jgi:hypothetical protein